MKIANNRALVAEKKTYEIPSVEMTQMTMSSIICVSGGTLHNSETGTETLGGGEIIGG